MYISAVIIFSFPIYPFLYFQLPVREINLPVRQAGVRDIPVKSKFILSTYRQSGKGNVFWLFMPGMLSEHDLKDFFDGKDECIFCFMVYRDWKQYFFCFLPSCSSFNRLNRVRYLAKSIIGKKYVKWVKWHL